VASYLIEGGRSTEYWRTKALMWSEPAAWDRLLSRIALVTTRYLRAQVDAGAQAVQLFDSWVGALGRDDYERFVQPYSARVLAELADAGVPVIHFVLGGAHLLEAQRTAGGTVMGVDWRLPLDEARRRVGHDCALQGNLDPLLLLAPAAVAVDRSVAIVRAAAGRVGHVFNLGHGILPETPVDTVRAVVDAVHEARLAQPER
jgi:uroporphyrinogen decarboxylase